MFEFIRGELRGRHSTHCVIESGGIGYRIQIPLSTYRALPEQGTVCLWIYSRISDEQFSLYGFRSENERDLFATMVETVPALGPRRAIGILSSMTVEELMDSVRRGEAGRLRNTKGIGDKLAGRLILELRGKLPEMGAPAKGSAYDEAILALVSLGFGRPEAQDAVARAGRELGEGASLESLIRASLSRVS